MRSGAPPKLAPVVPKNIVAPVISGSFFGSNQRVPSFMAPKNAQEDPAPINKRPSCAI